MKKYFLLISLVSLSSAVFALNGASPVVQVVAYKEPLGMYFALQGWGSGSLIDNRGHIITNNHVVDDGTGGIADDFAICMTDNPALPPRCHYTASVVLRDTDADIAILRLDSVDIFGKSVNFDTLNTLPMDMEYIPQSGDSVVARGYPWVGANTITETQGIVSGTAQYNTHTYIKTDTLIAGGNSGGPLIRDGKMIGVNTFLVGGGYDPSLGYSLLIRETRDLIQSAVSATKKLQSNSPRFPKFLTTLDTFATQQKIIDPLITYNLTEKYHIDSYIPAMTLQASLSDGSSTSVTSFGFYHMSTPRIADEDTLKNYIFRQFSLGDTSGFDLRPVNIGGKTFYEIVDRRNPDNDTIKSEYGYVSMLDETHMMVVFLSTPSPTKNTQEKIQKSVQDFLNNISFPAKFVFPEVDRIDIPAADIVLNIRQNSSISYDINDYQGLLSYLIHNQQDFLMVRDYLGNFWSKAQVAIFRNSFETQDDSVDAWFQNTTEGSYIKPVVKKKVTYRGHEGFMVCFTDTLTDESRKSQDVVNCEVVLLLGPSREYIVSIQMMLAQNQLRTIDTLMLQYITKTLELGERGNTDFGTISAPSLRHLYSDVSVQNPAFQEILTTLLQYGVLQNHPTFGGDTPLRWREYFRLFVWAVYHKRMTDTLDLTNPQSPTFEKALAVLPVSWDDYAQDDEWAMEKVHNLIRLIVAGGSLPNYSFDTVFDFSDSEYDAAGMYQSAWNTINQFESRYFSQKQSLEPALYTTTKNITYNPFTGLTTQPKSDTKGVSFFRNIQEEKSQTDALLQCYSNTVAYFSLPCRDLRKKTLVDALSYPVLTKGKAIQNILPYIDISLWDAPQ